MFILAMPVPSGNRLLIGQAMRVARAVSGLKLETIGALMGDLKASVIAEMERGDREPQLSRLYAMTRDDDGRRYVEAFTQEFASICQVEQTDRLVSEISKLFALVKTRMAKAELGNSESERRSA